MQPCVLVIMCISPGSTVIFPKSETAMLSIDSIDSIDTGSVEGGTGWYLVVLGQIRAVRV